MNLTDKSFSKLIKGVECLTF